MCINTHMHTHIHTHTHTHTRHNGSHTHTHTHSLSHSHTHKQTHTHKRAHARTNTHMHTHTHTHTHTHARAHTHTHTTLNITQDKHCHLRPNVIWADYIFFQSIHRSQKQKLNSRPHVTMKATLMLIFLLTSVVMTTLAQRRHGLVKRESKEEQYIFGPVKRENRVERAARDLSAFDMHRLVKEDNAAEMVDTK